MTNPYLPPKAEPNLPPEAALGAEDQQEASASQRLANLAIDYVAYIVLSTGFGVVVGLAGAFDWIEGPLGDLFGIVTLFGYYFCFEAVLGRTPGKFVTRTRVVSVDGGRASFAQILGRTLARFVPFEPFSFLGSAHGWHDRWSNTRVIRNQ